MVHIYNFARQHLNDFVNEMQYEEQQPKYFPFRNQSVNMLVHLYKYNDSTIRVQLNSYKTTYTCSPATSSTHSKKYLATTFGLWLVGVTFNHNIFRENLE